MLIFCALVSWLLFAGVFLYRGSRKFNKLNELGVLEFESYTQLLFFRVGGFFLGLVQFALLLVALMVSARWLVS